MQKRLIFFLLLLPFVSIGQYHITGKIIDSATKAPVADASIFLSNASAGAKSNADGTFTIANVRGGQYTLIASVVGYNTYAQSVLVNKDIDLKIISITKKNVMLKEVRIGPPRNWEKDYERFKSGFIGFSDNASNCTILNPHVLDFDSEDGVFTATAQDMLIIENKALGYRIKYMLYAYKDDKKNGQLYYAGAAFFENMPGSDHQLKKWKRKRREAYLGSNMHFLRSVIQNRVKEEGFKVERLIRKPNPAYNGFGNKYTATLITTPIETSDYSRITDKKGEYALQFKDCMYVVYNDNQAIGSTVTITSPYAYFDNNGIILNIQDVLMEGPWGDSRIPEMLPVDYEPDGK